MSEKQHHMNWRDEDMISAMEAVGKKELSIYKAAATFQVPYHFEGPEYALYCRSKSGWIDTELFMVWIKKIF